MYKNVANQQIAIYAHDTDADAPKTGDAGNITAYISKDGGGVAQSNDVNPTELDATNAKGIYIFNLTQAETNCDLFVLSATSTTNNIQIEPVMAYTETSPVTALSDYDPPTKAEMDAGFSGLNDLSAAEVNAEVDSALTDYGGPTKAEMDDAIAGLNDVSTAEITAAIEALASYKQLRAFARGKTVVDATNYPTSIDVDFYDTDDVTLLYTLTITNAGRTVA